MFSPRIYWRLFESINETCWPLQLPLLALGLGWLGWQLSPRSRSAGDATWRAAALLLAALWGWVAWAFLLQRFAPINWPATQFAQAFALQALALLLLALVGGVAGRASTWRFRAGIGLGLWSLVGHPLLPLVFDRPWQQAEFFGLAPDPTAIATLALLLLIDTHEPRRRWLLRALWVLPLAWCAISAATLATMGSAQSLVMVAAAVLALLAARR